MANYLSLIGVQLVTVNDLIQSVLFYTDNMVSVFQNIVFKSFALVSLQLFVFLVPLLKNSSNDILMVIILLTSELILLTSV